VTSAELDRRFPTDDACLEFLKERLYPTGTPCPSCKKGSRFHRIAGRSAYSCQFCGHHVYPTSGTIFHKSRTSLRLWFRAIELMRTSGDELTARALERELGVSYKTALRMQRQIRALLEEDPDPLAGGDAARTLTRARPSQGRHRTGNRAVKESRVQRASRQPHRRRGGGMNKRFEWRKPAHRRYALRAIVVAAIVVGAALGVSQARESGNHQARPNSPHFMRVGEGQFATSLNAVRTGEPSGLDGPNQEIYSNQAYPALTIAAAQRQAAATAAAKIKTKPAKKKGGGWTLVGPQGVPASETVASESTAATKGTVFSGRTTALAVSPSCTSKTCPMLVGAAGGGVWSTTNAMTNKPKWVESNGSIPSNAIGSIAYDPNDPTGNTVYVGTGEPNGSSDSEAGVGLYKSLDGGQTWTRVFGSVAPTAPCAANLSLCPVSTGRSIGAVAVDPTDPSHIFIGTDVARHGSSSVNGGRFTPPGAALVGLYESTDGGASFAPVLIQNQDVVDATSANGSDFFRGGVSNIQIDKATGDVYASVFDYGLFRRSQAQDGDTAFHQVFASAGGGTLANSSFSRTEFSLAANGAALRIYVGDTGDGGTADFYTVADANVPAATLLTSWVKKSDPTNGTPGFGSYNYCVGQCSYDMPVYSPPGHPDTVYIGGAMQYDEIFTGDPIPNRSNGRAIQRSEDDGTNFTDMTIDSKGISLHPDQHVITGVPCRRHRPADRRRPDRLPALAVEDPEDDHVAQRRPLDAPVPEPVDQRQEPEGHPGRHAGQRDAGDDERQEVVRDDLRRRRPVRHQRRQSEDPDAHVLLAERRRQLPGQQGNRLGLHGRPTARKRRGRVLLRAADLRPEPDGREHLVRRAPARLADPGQRGPAGSARQPVQRVHGHRAVRHHLW
jgi:transposase-like protein